jgi:hypothetical protein
MHQMSWPVENAVIDGCDGDDMLNIPDNYKFRLTLREGEWAYDLVPLTKQLNEVSCMVLYNFPQKDGSGLYASRTAVERAHYSSRGGAQTQGRFSKKNGSWSVRQQNSKHKALYVVCNLKPC